MDKYQPILVMPTPSGRIETLTPRITEDGDITDRGEIPLHPDDKDLLCKTFTNVVLFCWHEDLVDPAWSNLLPCFTDS
jgi:hypothetical protein